LPLVFSRFNFIRFIYYLNVFFTQEKKLERKRRKEEAEALGENAPPKQVPHTLETLREKDDTMVGTDDTYEDFEIQTDEFAPYFRKDYVPKIIITSSHNPTLVFIA